MSNSYLEVISLVERLHRQFLEVVKLELEGLRIHDINNVQAMMLFNIGDAEMTGGGRGFFPVVAFLHRAATRLAAMPSAYATRSATAVAVAREASNPFVT